MQKQKRVNKTKEEIAYDMKVQQVAKEKIALVRRIYPLVKDQKSIYDIQTALYGLAGYIKAELQKREREILLSDLNLDFSNEPKDNEITKAILAVYADLSGEKAWMLEKLLSEFGDSLQKYGAHKYMQQTPDAITESEIIAD